MRYPNINAERARMGLSWGQLAGILGVTRKTLYSWTTKGCIPQNALIQMEDIFGCSMATVSKGSFTAAAVVEKIGCLAVFFYLLAILYSRREKR